MASVSSGMRAADSDMMMDQNSRRESQHRISEVSSPQIKITNESVQGNSGSAESSALESSVELDKSGAGSKEMVEPESHNQNGSPEMVMGSLNNSNDNQGRISDIPAVANRASLSVAPASGKARSSSPKGSKKVRNFSRSSITTSSASSNAACSTLHEQQAQPIQERTRLQSAATQLKNFLVPNYKSRSEEFKKLFKPAENDKFVIDYSCAYQREILVHGRMYVSQHLLCFYANIFTWETTIVVRLKDITNISKEKTAKVIPNALQVITRSGDKLFFTSFSMRDKAYMMLFRVWQNELMDKLMHPAELYSLENQGYDEAEFSGSDHEAEDALVVLEESGESSKPSIDDEHLNLRDVAWEPNLASISIESIEEWEEDTAGSKARQTNGTSGLSLETVCANSAASSAGTAATTPAEEYTESDNDTEINCPCTSHAGKEMLNCVYPISVDQLFLLLFTDSLFFRKLHDDRKTADLVLSDWAVDKSTGTKWRQITYVVALNHSLGPKSCAVTEKQTCEASSKPGQLYILKSDVSNSGIPYSDTFSIGVQYCLARVSANQSRIRVHAGIVYKKSCWGIVKSFLDKSALAGMGDYFADLDAHLHAECARFGLTNSSETVDTGKETMTIRSRRQSTKTPHVQVSTGSPVRKSKSANVTKTLVSSEMENTVKGILAILILMLLLNAALFYKLWYFEMDTERGSFENTLQDFERVLQKSDVPPSEWFHVFHQLRFAQRKQLIKWLQELDTAVARIVQVQTALTELRKQVATLKKDVGVKADVQPISEKDNGKTKDQEENIGRGRA